MRHQADRSKHILALPQLLVEGVVLRGAHRYPRPLSSARSKLLALSIIYNTEHCCILYQIYMYSTIIQYHVDTSSLYSPRIYYSSLVLLKDPFQLYFMDVDPFAVLVLHGLLSNLAT